jgi:hypothetical protein
LDAAQQINFVNSTVVNPSIYKLWSSDEKLLDATLRGNLLEATRNCLSPGPKGVSSAKEDTFKDLRQIIMAFANFEAKRQYFSLMDNSTFGYVKSCHLNKKVICSECLFKL